ISLNVGGQTHWILRRFLERSPTLTQDVANMFNARIDHIYDTTADDQGPAVKCLEGTQPIRCSDHSVYATTGPAYINLCNKFFDGLDILGQAATLVHEITHYAWDTVDYDLANDDASLSDIGNPTGIFSGANTLLNSNVTEICKRLNSGAQAACV